MKKILLLVIMTVLGTGLLPAQMAPAAGPTVRVKLTDAATSEPIGFATVYVSKDGTTGKAVFALTGEDGVAVLEGVKRGKYIFKAEMMGYNAYTADVTVSDKDIDLGTVKMESDVAMLDQAVVSATANAIVVKKDTIEYNVDMFKTTDNDVLEDLLKKLPGIEVGSDGSITANGKTINKITIAGRTFFLDDPQIASKNIPAKMINKVKVLEKKSEQAEFTGIDDGEEETVLDLSVRPGMMKGWFGTVTGGGGHDLPTEEQKDLGSGYDGRWQGSGMVGRFTDKSQISFIGNGNNTNNRGLQDMASSMMGQMRGGGGPGGGMGGGRGMFGGSNGITTSWMGGVNANTGFGDDSDNEIGGNYMYNGSDNSVVSESTKKTFLTDQKNMLSTNTGSSNTITRGHRAGAEFEWAPTKKFSLLFRPQFSYGTGSFDENSNVDTRNTFNGGAMDSLVNKSTSSSRGDNDNWSTNGRLLLRQRLGGNVKGRSISLNIDYKLSKSTIVGYNSSTTMTDYDYDSEELDEDDKWKTKTVVDQRYNQTQKSASLSGNLTYTEPLGKNFFLQGSYQFSWSRNESEKLTYDKESGFYSKMDTAYSNQFDNNFINQNMRLSFVKQEDKYNLQIGVSGQPAKTDSKAYLFNAAGSRRTYRDTSYTVWNFSPTARIEFEFSDYEFLRLNYRGQTSQPSINQLSPVPDNSNPLYITLGNPTLAPSFNHRIGLDYRRTNMKTFGSIGAMTNFTYTKDAIVNASWYTPDGIQYTLPLNVNGPSYSGMLMVMGNTPLGGRDSKFSMNSFTRFSASSALSYSGNGDAKTFEEILASKALQEGRTTSIGINENLSFVYRNNWIETRLGGVIGYNRAWYTISTKQNAETWNNQVTAEINGDLPWNMEVKTDGRYYIYHGYSDGYNENKFVWNAEVAQSFFNSKLTLRLKVYDILNKSQNINRTTTENYVQDSLSNTLGRYVMLSLTFKFGNFGEAGKHMPGPGGRRGGMGGPGAGGPPMGPPPGM